MTRQRPDALTVGWLAVAVAGVALVGYCGVSVISDEERLSERTADLERTRELALEIASLDSLVVHSVISAEDLGPLVQSQVEAEGVAPAASESVRVGTTQPIPATQLFSCEVTVTLPNSDLKTLIRLLQLRETTLPYLLVSGVKIEPPIRIQQKTPECWQAEITLTYVGTDSITLRSNR